MATSSSNYSDKLKDPRWQKKRLEILDRDKWSCQICGDKELTLHVHHKIYEKDREPWDIENGLLVTLCESCHKKETLDSYGINRYLIKEVRRHFNCVDMIDIFLGFNKMKLTHSREIVSVAIGKALSNPKTLQILIDISLEDHGKSSD